MGRRRGGGQGESKGGGGGGRERRAELRQDDGQAAAGAVERQGAGDKGQKGRAHRPATGLTPPYPLISAIVVLVRACATLEASPCTCTRHTPHQHTPHQHTP